MFLYIVQTINSIYLIYQTVIQKNNDMCSVLTNDVKYLYNIAEQLDQQINDSFYMPLAIYNDITTVDSDGVIDERIYKCFYSKFFDNIKKCKIKCDKNTY